MNYMNFYNNISNPIDDDNIIDRLIDIYVKENNLYEGIINFSYSAFLNNKNNEEDIDILYVRMFNYWKESMKIYYKKNHFEITRDDRKIYDGAIKYLDSVSPKSRNEVMDILCNPKSGNEDINSFIFSNRPNKVGENSGFVHIDSSNVFFFTHKRMPILHRLYVNCDSTIIYKFSNIFIEKCLKNKTRFYFKFSPYANRDDTFVLYCDDKHLAVFTRIINEIINENSDIKDGIKNPPILSGKVNEFIGYGSEPNSDEFGKHHSFNEIRKIHLQDSLHNINCKLIKKYIDKDVKCSNGKVISYRDYLISILTKSIIEKMSNGQTSSYKKNIINNDYDNIKTQVENNLDNLLYCFYNDDECNFTIKIGNKSFIIYSHEYEYIFRKQLLNLKRDNLRNIFRKEIKNTAKDYGIDPENYAFDKSCVERFKLLDGKREEEIKEPEYNYEKMKIKKYMPMPEEEIIESQKKLGFKK